MLLDSIYVYSAIEYATLTYVITFQRATSLALLIKENCLVFY